MKVLQKITDKKDVQENDWEAIDINQMKQQFLEIMKEQQELQKEKFSLSNVID